MASLHSQGEKKITLLFCEQRRGRLFPYRQGLFRTMYSDDPVKVGQKGVPDLIGFTFPNIATFVEVKTIAAPKFRKEQKSFMNYAASKGCICLAYREQRDGSWAEFSHGQSGFYK